MVRFTNESYDATKCVRIVNPKQAYLYMKHGLYPVDIYPGYDVTVYVFEKTKAQPLFDKWVKHELK